jgi:hypothetical protein
MINRQDRVSLVVLAAVAGLVLAPASPSLAQLITSPTLTNSSNADESVAGTASAPSRERKSFLEVLSSSPSGGFVTRYSSQLSVDGDGAGAGSGVESLSSDYQLDFTATAPGAYILTVTTGLSGDMHLVNDGPNSASADVGPISGASTGGTNTSGSFDIADPGSVSGNGGGDVPMSDGSSATIFGVSNGSPVPHNLHFVFTQIVTTNAGGGDEAAVRLGINSTISTETAGDYPGSPARTQSDDGHFVTVTIQSLCGNGTIDSGPSYTEQCDDGPNNGQPNDCCAADCTFVTDGSPCTDNNVCTNGDSCQSGVCVSGPPQTCPSCQTCDGNMGCIVGPKPNCKLTTSPFQSKFLIKHTTPDTGDQVSFKWSRGAATSVSDFGSPTTTDDYALCVFNPGLVMQLDAPAGGVCGTSQCWKTLSIKGFAYKDSLRTPDGVDKVVLKAGLAGKAKVQLKGKGSNLPALPLPLTLPATVQLQSENGQCWEGDFVTGNQQSNTSTLFKGKGN